MTVEQYVNQSTEVSDVPVRAADQKVAGQAEQTAANIDNLGDRASALTAIAGMLAAAGQLEEAQRVAADIDNPSDRARTLTATALELVQIGDVRQAARLVTAAWTLDEWKIPLRAVAAIRGSALVALGELN